MRVVLDSCIALKWVLREDDSPKANQFRGEFRQQLHELMAPDVFPVEVAHAVTRAERRGLASQPALLVGNVLSTAPILYPSLQLLPRAIELSSQFRIGVYDCLYRALAEQEDCDLLTADARLAMVFPRVILLEDL